MTNRKSSRTAYWITTGLLVFGMLSGGIAQLLRAKWNVEGMGVWKILGVIALLVPGYRLVKEWAYAGFFFVITGAVISHLASGDGIKGVIAQVIFVVLIVLSWYFRPEGRRIVVGG